MSQLIASRSRLTFYSFFSCPLPNPDICPEDSSDFQVTPPLTHGSPSEGWSENESFGEVTPEAPAALSFNVWLVRPCSASCRVHINVF